MNVIQRIAQWLKPAPTADALRARPLQKQDSIFFPQGITPDVAKYIALYALNTWVYTAVARLSDSAKTASLEVIQRSDPTKKFDDHGLVKILGKYGKPNEHQSTQEFWGDFWTYFELSGNAYVYWKAETRGAPSAAYLLEPQNVRIVPGSTRAVQRYEYWLGAERYRIDPMYITHFRRPNPFNRYYGLPAFEALMVSVIGDVHASRWNRDFFGDGVSIPAGIFVIPSDVSNQERDRLADELNARHGTQRRTAVVRADAGSTIWHDAGLKPNDMQFENQRKLTRQEVYEALDIPLGYLSEASTEAHARVAERQFMAAIWRRLQFVADKMNPEVMEFWSRSNTLAAQFDDPRREAADWEQQERKYRALKDFTTVNERREMAGFERMEGHDQLTGGGQESNWGDNRSLQQEGQVPDMVESSE